MVWGRAERQAGACFCPDETPFPFPGGGPSGPVARGVPQSDVDSLPSHSLGGPEADLALLEEALCASGRMPVYVVMTHEALQFPVVRAFVPGMELAADRDTFSPHSLPAVGKLPAAVCRRIDERQITKPLHNWLCKGFVLLGCFLGGRRTGPVSPFPQLDILSLPLWQTSVTPPCRFTARYARDCRRL